jgi:hypothetical protein
MSNDPKHPKNLLSEAMSEFMDGATHAKHSDIVKAVWEHVRANSLKQGNGFRVDARLKKLFPNVEVMNSFSLNTYDNIGRHFVNKARPPPKDKSVAQPRGVKKVLAMKKPDTIMEKRMADMQKELVEMRERLSKQES